jgi:hypothetical protein
LGGNLDTNGKTLDTVNLEAYSDITSITGNAVDIFIYDTSKDSDGGAWRKRTQDTSWYNEAASTTRGSRKDFPAVAVIVAEASKVTIYDGDTPDLDMWMVFNHNIGGGVYSGVAAINSSVVVSATDNGILILDYVKDVASRNNDTYYFPYMAGGGGIANRDITPFVWGSLDTSRPLVNQIANDVAMTVLPNAPIDSATGLPTPTIAVATNGGVSIIKDDGTVVDITASAGSAYNHAGFITFSPDNKLVFEMDSGDRDCYYIGIPSADRTVQTHSGLHTDKVISYDSTSGVNGLGRFKNAVAGKNENTYFAHTEGVTNLIPNISTPKEGSVAYITSKYNTGYMTGDIRGAWNVDTDVTTLGTNILTNGNFDSDVSGWSGDSGAAITWNSMSFATVGNGGGDNTYAIKQTGFLTIGTQYRIKFRFRPNNTGTFRIRMSGTVWSTTSFTTNSWNDVDAVVTSGSTWLEIGSNGGNITSFDIDDISITEAIPDRSVKGNGLAVHGTPTVSAVATGAELKGMNFGSSTQYLKQTGFDTPSGDMSLMFWTTSFTSDDELVTIDDALTGSNPSNGIHLWTFGGQCKAYWGGTAVYTPAGSLTGANTLIAYVQSGSTITAYVNGKVEATSSTLNAITDTTLYVGGGWYAGGGNNMALIRISATAPTAEQIKEIYEAEKPLFQDNTKCTLNGTSDAVTAMSYDDSNEELLVGTSGGLSVFKGLRRVDENTNNISEVAQQGGLRVEEY